METVRNRHRNCDKVHRPNLSIGRFPFALSYFPWLGLWKAEPGGTSSRVLIVNYQRGECVRRQASGHCHETLGIPETELHPLLQPFCPASHFDGVHIPGSAFLRTSPVSFKRNETLAGRWRKDMCLIYARVKRNAPGGWNRSTQFRGPVTIVDIIKSRINCFDDTQWPWKGRVLLLFFFFFFFFNLWWNMSKLWTFVRSCIFNYLFEDIEEMEWK